MARTPLNGKKKGKSFHCLAARGGNSAGAWKSRTRPPFSLSPSSNGSSSSSSTAGDSRVLLRCNNNVCNMPPESLYSCLQLCVRLRLYLCWDDGDRFGYWFGWGVRGDRGVGSVVFFFRGRWSVWFIKDLFPQPRQTSPSNQPTSTSNPSSIDENNHTPSILIRLSALIRRDNPPIDDDDTDRNSPRLRAELAGKTYSRAFYATRGGLIGAVPRIIGSLAGPDAAALCARAARAP